MKVLTTTAFLTSLLFSTSHAVPSSSSSGSCSPSTYIVPNGGFEGPASLAPWVIENDTSNPGYTAKRVKTKASMATPSNKYEFFSSPAIPENPNSAAQAVDLFQNFPVCGGHMYNITFDWYTLHGNASSSAPSSQMINSGMRLFASADPDDECPNNCVWQYLYQVETTGKASFPNSSLQIKVPKVKGNKTSAISLMFESYTYQPFDRRQGFLLDNVAVTNVGPA